jgi:hypothetical protein
VAASTAIFGALLLASGSTQDAPAPAEPFDLAKLKIDQCPGERFDFQAGETTKVGLCSKAGASNEDIATMLQSAITQLESSDRMRAESRDAIVAQMRAKLAEVRAR